MRVIYIAGPFRGPSAWAIESNIRVAESLALEVWRAGAVAVCPHANSRYFQGAAPDDIWLTGYLELLRRCDAVLVTPDWTRSAGAMAEVAEADAHGLPVFDTLAGLVAWLRDGAS